jgi:glycosyltransferase involved in cell wall biosynthesis
MKIALLHRYYPPNGLTYSTTHFYATIAKAFATEGHEVHVISQGIEKRDFITRGGVYVHEVGTWPRRRDIPFLSHFIYLFNAWRKLTELVKQFHIEVVDAYVFSAHGFFPALFKQVPLVLEVHAWSEMFLKSKNYSGFLRFLGLKITTYLEEFSLKRADKIIVTSPQTYQYFVEKKCFPEEKVSIIWDSRIDLNKFRFTPSDIRSRFDIPSDVNFILYVGTLDVRKGVHILAEAMPKVIAFFPNTLFVFLGRDTLTAPGGGSFKQYLLNYASKRGILANVKFIESFVSEEDLVKLYSACDIFVLPSLWEGASMTIPEAMACNRPVVATETGNAVALKGISPVLKVVPIGDSKALAQAIIEILSIPKEERERLSARHRQIVERYFSFERMVEQILTVYREAISLGQKKKARRKFKRT